jgi:hypothetical protein
VKEITMGRTAESLNWWIHMDHNYRILYEKNIRITCSI